MTAGALLLFPGAGSSRTHPSLVAIEKAVEPLPVVRADFPYRKAGRSAPDRPPVLMATVQDELTSNLQTFITLQAEKKGHLAPSGSHTLEAQFDERDILGWAGSFFTWWRKLNPFPVSKSIAMSMSPGSSRWIPRRAIQ